MRKRREFPCYDMVEAAVDCIDRGTVLLQNLAEYGDRADVDSLLRQLQGLAAASHRGWRELNERLARAFVTSVEREDVSALVRDMAEVSALFPPLVIQWRAGRLESAPAWTARLAAGGHTLRELAAQLPLLRQDNTLSACAETLYALRRESDAQLAQDIHRTSGASWLTAVRFHDCCTALARLADTAEWMVLKNG